MANYYQIALELQSEFQEMELHKLVNMLSKYGYNKTIIMLLSL